MNTQFLGPNLQYVAANNSVHIHLGLCPIMEFCDKPMFTVTDNTYNHGGPWSFNDTEELVVDVSSSGNWYDFTISSNCYYFVRRYMGRMETGEESITDPAMATKSINLEDNNHPQLLDELVYQPSWWET